jgi:hypothetical protein
MIILKMCLDLPTVYCYSNPDSYCNFFLLKPSGETVVANYCRFTRYFSVILAFFLLCFMPHYFCETVKKNKKKMKPSCLLGLAATVHVRNPRGPNTYSIFQYSLAQYNHDASTPLEFLFTFFFLFFPKIYGSQNNTSGAPWGVEVWSLFKNL